MQLQIKNLTYKRLEQPILSDLSLNIIAGQCLCIEGPNGSGKSTLLRLCAGLLPSQQGAIYFNGQAIADIHSSYQAHLHYVAHNNGLKLDLTVEENLLLCAHLQDVNIDSTLAAVLTDLHLATKRHTPIKYLSAGQRRRVSLAKLVLIPKSIWLLDEPFTALDKTSQSYFLAKIQAHLTQHGIVIMSTHHDLPDIINKQTLHLT